jgi:hypothetical protein
VLLLSVVQPPGLWELGDLDQQLIDVREILGQTFALSLAAGAAPELLTTVAPDPWSEIARVARSHRCESLLLGLGELSRETLGTRVEGLVGSVQSDVVVLRAPPGWRLAEARRVLVAVGGRRDQSLLRARLLASLCRTGEPRISYLRVLPPETSAAGFEEARRELGLLAQDEVPREAQVTLVRAGDALAELVRRAAEHDLMVLGLQRRARRRKMFGEFTLRLAAETTGPLILLSRR